MVDALDLKPFLRRFRDNGQGGAAFHPAMMLMVVLYAYCVDVPSSRKIAQAVIDDVAFRWLAANNRPDFRTIATFRRKHLENIKPLFLQVLLMCKQARMVRVGVMLSCLERAGSRQRSLLETALETDDRGERLMAVLDKANARWGRDALRFAACGIEQPWQMKQAARSPRYTTAWAELPVVKAL